MQSAADEAAAAPRTCNHCGSADVCVSVAQGMLFCRTCGSEQSLIGQTSVDEYFKVLDLTTQLVPDAIKCWFVSSQSLSITQKLQVSKKMLLDYYNGKGNFTTAVEVKRVLRLLVKLNRLWDLADLHSLRIASKVIQNICQSEDAGPQIFNFFGAFPQYQPNEFTAICVVWVQCLVCLHFVCCSAARRRRTPTDTQALMADFLNLEGKVDRDREELMRVSLEKSFEKLNKKSIDAVYDKLVAEGIQSVLDSF